MLLVVTNIAYGVGANRTPHNVTTSTETPTTPTPTISTTPRRTLTKSFKLTTQSLTNKTVTAGYQSLTTCTYLHMYVHRDMNQTLAYIQTYLKYITTEAVLWPKLWQCNAICCCLVKEGGKK